MEPEKEFQDREDKRKQLFLNQKQLLDTFLDMGEALTTRSGFARPENGTYGAMGGARANALPLPYCAGQGGGSLKKRRRCGTLPDG